MAATFKSGFPLDKVSGQVQDEDKDKEEDEPQLVVELAGEWKRACPDFAEVSAAQA